MQRRSQRFQFRIPFEIAVLSAPIGNRLNLIIRSIHPPPILGRHPLIRRHRLDRRAPLMSTLPTSKATGIF
jgi:hypothetical protein